MSLQSAAMPTNDQHTRSPQRNDGFATTRWSVVVAAGQESSPDSKRALETLCETYWLPLYGYVRRRVPDVAEAHDLTQAFFVELLARNYVNSAIPERGRFRAFLLTSFRHFLSKQWDRAKAQKRGGGRVPISLDFATADTQMTIDPAAGLTAEQLYDRQWAVTLLSRIMERLGREFADAGRTQQFEEFKPFLVGEHAGTTYVDVAARLNMTTAAAKMAVSRMRRRYRELLREEIAQTVASPEEVDDEIRNLFVTLEL